MKNLFLLSLAFLLITGLSYSQKKNSEKPAKAKPEETFHSLKWRNIGPFRGGRSVAVTGVPGEMLTFYMGSTGGGIWKTTDGGISWDNISDGQLKTGSVGAISVAASDPNVLYAGMGEHAVRGVMTSAGDGIYRSTDKGKTWKHAGLEKSQHISDVVIHSSDPDLVYVAVQGALYGPSSEKGIYKTVDGGKSWKKILFIDENSGASGLELDPSNPRILYAAFWDHQRTPWKIRSGGPGSGIHKSTDGGETWKELKNGLPGEMGKIGISVSPANPQRIYAVIEAEDKKGGIYRSDDGGEKWQQVNNDRINIARSWYYNEIVADPKDPETVYVLNSPLTKSIDGGKTFTGIPVPHVDLHDHWINPENTQIMINANDGGAAITFNGGKTWSTQENQPTAQFYRVIADKRFPYHLYAGQQDNSAIAITSQSLTNVGIDWKDWYSVAGGESAYLAFDPNDPDVLYGSSIEGFLDRYTHSTGERKDLTVYPELSLGKAPMNMKYRFNWNPPLITSPHDTKTMYYGAQHLLKTTDGGFSWSEISPDLTRNEKEKQGPGGGPFTNEAAGGENYNTIMFIAESPHEKGVLWIGTDDGLVHLSRDGGKNWKNVTPPGLQESIINAIEVSPHDPATVYIAVMRYKFSDTAPYIFKTTDYGQSWQKMINGIEPGHFVRVVREDKKEKGLLYAGTERGIYLSRNGGKNWDQFQLNLPQVPVTDITIAENDLIAATAGRGFWILDDLNPVQQAEKFRERPLLVIPEKAIRISTSSPPVPVNNMGQNPPNGAIIDYYLPQEPDSAGVSIKIFDRDNNLLRTYKSMADEKGGITPASGEISAKKGVNRLAWDLRKDKVETIKDQFMYGSNEGHIIAPGNFTVQLKTGKDSVTTKLTVVKDPRLKISDSAYDMQQELLAETDVILEQIFTGINEMKKAKNQVESWNALLPKEKKYNEIRNKGKAIIDSLESWEQELIQVKHETFQDVINMPNKLATEFMFLKSYLESNDPRITKGSIQRFEDLQEEYNNQQKKLDHILEGLLPQYNQLFKELEVPAVIYKK